MDSKTKVDFKSFLFRLWRDRDVDSWRGTLENPHDGKKFTFANINNLIDFLKEISEDIRIMGEINDE
jgi:hypothetical protein